MSPDKLLIINKLNIDKLSRQSYLHSDASLLFALRESLWGKPVFQRYNWTSPIP
jgi:hypothetical protein